MHIDTKEEMLALSQRNFIEQEERSRQRLFQDNEHEIGYRECANALLKMWIDNVVTDGEYYRIIDKLNKCWGKDL